MDTDTTAQPQPRGASVKNIKYFLLGLLLDCLLLSVYFLFFTLGISGRVDCYPCTAAQYFLACVKGGLGLGLFYMMFLWHLLIPLLLAPLVVGLVIDCRLYERRTE